jgi:hypothetical protein
MKYVDDAEQGHSDSHVVERLFDRTGEPVINKKEKSYAKVIKTTSRSGRYEHHYIRTYQSAPYDPWGMHSHREDYVETKLQKVQAETFNFYMMFLKTRNMLYMTRAQRSFIND